MKKKLLVTLTLALGLGLMLTLAIAYAQEPTAEPREEEPSGEIHGLGLTDPAPTGFSVLYMFTGVHNDTTGPNGVATSVHCTNFDTKAISLTLQFFNTGGGTVTSFTDNLVSNETGTYSTQGTFFNETPLNLGTFAQGSGRVLATTSKVICTAQLVEPGSITPTFMVRLPMFDNAGNLIGGNGGPVFLPVILKQ
jgi:hypothetical protein